MANPCTCVGRILSDPADPVASSDDCLTVCDIVILADDAVGPCGTAGQIDLSDDTTYGHDFTGCGATSPVWQLISWDNTVFASVVLNPATGVLDWITGDADTAGQYGEITVKVLCDSLAAYMKVLIGVKDLCIGVACAAGEECNPCTGLCQPIVDVEID